jgi:hypothetical protein
VDGIMVLNRERGNADAFLYTTGRDVDDKELALTFEGESLSWILKGDAAAYRLNEARRLIVKALTEEPNLSATAVAQKIGKPRTSVGEMLRRMESDGVVTEEGNKWRVTGGVESDPSHLSYPSGTSDPSHPSPIATDGYDGSTSEAPVTLNADEQAKLSDSDGSDGSDVWEAIVDLWESEKVQDHVEQVWPLLKPNRDATLAEFETLQQEQKDEVTEIWHEQKVDFPFIKSPAQMYYELKRATQLEILTMETAVKISNGELEVELCRAGQDPATN